MWSHYMHSFRCHRNTPHLLWQLLRIPSPEPSCAFRRHKWQFGIFMNLILLQITNFTSFKVSTNFVNESCLEKKSSKTNTTRVSSVNGLIRHYDTMITVDEHCKSERKSNVNYFSRGVDLKPEQRQ